MQSNRRAFLKLLTCAGSLFVTGRGSKAHAAYSGRGGDQLGVLVDTTLCIGCRSCEKACNRVNEDLPQKPSEYFKDNSVFDMSRRMDSSSYTVVNRYENQREPGNPVYAKFQCMHCVYPACESACIVGAFSREKNGAVVYDAWRCIGCRYCMAACPFQVPAYEYKNALTPQVRKCTFCFETRLLKGGIPACVQSCPMEVMTFGKRKDLIISARKKIEKYPGRYVPNIYGEKEVGGTAWLYLSAVPFEKIGFPHLGYYPAPGYTEPIQHAIFKLFLPPLGVYTILGGIMWFLNKKKKSKKLVHKKEE